LGAPKDRYCKKRVGTEVFKGEKTEHPYVQKELHSQKPMPKKAHAKSAGEVKPGKEVGPVQTGRKVSSVKCR